MAETRVWSRSRFRQQYRLVRRATLREIPTRPKHGDRELERAEILARVSVRHDHEGAPPGSNAEYATDVRRATTRLPGSGRPARPQPARPLGCLSATLHRGGTP